MFEDIWKAALLSEKKKKSSSFFWKENLKQGVKLSSSFSLFDKSWPDKPDLYGSVRCEETTFDNGTALRNAHSGLIQYPNQTMFR